MKSMKHQARTKQRGVVGFMPNSEGERSELKESGMPGGPSPARPIEVPDPELPKPVRRHFTAAFKLRILKEIDNAPEGEIGAILRREGLYYSNLTSWRGQREKGELEGLKPKMRGPHPKMTSATRQRLAQMERENKRLTRRLEQAEKIIAIQKKIAELLGNPITSDENS